MLKTVSITVTGKVQGVYYRQSTKKKATELAITGYVRNQPDGTVFIVATGTKEQLQQLISWCQQGPPAAIVSSIKTAELPLQQFEQFSVQKS